MGRNYMASDLCLGPANHEAHRSLPLHDLNALEVYHKALEDERLKIQAFERELPFCMQLLDQAIETSREHLADRLTCKLNPTPSASSAPPVQLLCSYGGLKTRNLPALGEIMHEVKRIKWPAVSVGLGQADGFDGAAMAATCKDNEENAPPPGPGEWLFKPKNEGGEQSRAGAWHGAPMVDAKRAFQPYSGKKAADHEEAMQIQRGFSGTEYNGRPLADSRTEPPTATTTFGDGARACGSAPVGRARSPASLAAPAAGGSVQRKPRRCWSPDLHQRFLHALHQLGGCQVATPKQIRELMDVKGLTNDEVKSHLQKFRLHMRRPSLGAQTDHHHQHHHPHHSFLQQQQPSAGGGALPGPPPHHLLVFGRVWVPPSNNSSSAAANASRYSGVMSNNHEADPDSYPGHAQAELMGCGDLNFTGHRSINYRAGQRPHLQEQQEELDDNEDEEEDEDVDDIDHHLEVEKQHDTVTAATRVSPKHRETDLSIGCIRSAVEYIGSHDS